MITILLLIIVLLLLSPLLVNAIEGAIYLFILIVKGITWTVNKARSK